MDLKSIILSISDISEESVSSLLGYIETVEYAKGYILSHAGRKEHYVYFMGEGIVRAYKSHDGIDTTFWFGLEGDVILSMRNYTDDRPSYESIELMEDSLLYRIRMTDLKNLYDTNLEIANWGRRIAEKEVIKAENRLIELQFMTATERYNLLLKKSPSLLNRIPLGIIASYLGMTQVSLSRIRRNI